MFPFTDSIVFGMSDDKSVARCVDQLVTVLGTQLAHMYCVEVCDQLLLVIVFSCCFVDNNCCSKALGVCVLM